MFENLRAGTYASDAQHDGLAGGDGLILSGLLHLLFADAEALADRPLAVARGGPIDHVAGFPAQRAAFLHARNDGIFRLFARFAMHTQGNFGFEPVAHERICLRRRYADLHRRRILQLLRHFDGKFAFGLRGRGTVAA